MCKACKMDPGETARFRLRQGAIPIEDFDEEPRIRHPKRRMSRKEKYPRVKTRPGCEANDYKAHIYIWTDEVVPTNYLFYKFYGWHSVEWKVCCGCGKKNDSRKSPRYEKVKSRKWTKMYGEFGNVVRGTPVPRYGRYGGSYSYWSWENYDEDFVAYKKDYMTRHGWTNAVYGPSIYY